MSRFRVVDINGVVVLCLVCFNIFFYFWTRNYRMIKPCGYGRNKKRLFKVRQRIRLDSRKYPKAVLWGLVRSQFGVLREPSRIVHNWKILRLFGFIKAPSLPRHWLLIANTCPLEPSQNSANETAKKAFPLVTLSHRRCYSCSPRGSPPFISFPLTPNHTHGEESTEQVLLFHLRRHA